MRFAHCGAAPRRALLRSLGITPMKIIEWNLNHRTIEKPIPDEALTFFSKYSPDIIVLTEYVDADSRNNFKQRLMEVGFSHQLISPKVVKQNQIFIASKQEIQLGDLTPPDLLDAARTNFLHISIPDCNIEIVGFRAPSYKLASERFEYWKIFAEIVRSANDRNIVFIGDINYDPFSGVTAFAPEISFSLERSFRIPNPEGEWSFISIDGKNKSRIDHAVVSDGVKVCKASYMANYDGIVLAGARSDAAITDHAALSLEVEVLSS